jgi:predicted TPR repeat methyltransferase
MPKKFLDEVYEASEPQAVADLYDKWAGSYDSELAQNAYATPDRLAMALAETEVPTETRILDFGCGTGLSGLALVGRGYTLIDGADLSAEMLAEAEAKQIYGRLWQADSVAALPVTLGEYGVVVAAGVVSPGAAPASLLGDLAGLLERGGHLAFSFNDHALADPDYLDALRTLRDGGDMTCLFEEYGDHLPGIGLKSTIYVFQKA